MKLWLSSEIASPNCACKARAAYIFLGLYVMEASLASFWIQKMGRGERRDMFYFTCLSALQDRPNFETKDMQVKAIFITRL